MCLATSLFAYWQRDLHRWPKTQEVLIRILLSVSRPKSSTLWTHYSKSVE